MKKASLVVLLLISCLSCNSQEKNYHLSSELIMKSLVPLDSSLYSWDSLSLYHDNIAATVFKPSNPQIKLVDLIIDKASESHLKLYNPYPVFIFYENISFLPSRFRSSPVNIPESQLNEILLGAAFLIYYRRSIYIF